MSSPNSSISRLTGFTALCRSLISNKVQQFNDKLYQDLLQAYQDNQHDQNAPQMHQILYQEHQSIIVAQSPSYLSQKPEQFIEATQSQQQLNNQPQTLPLNTLIKPQINSITEQISNQQPDQQPFIQHKKSIKLKPNPRMHKFMKQQKQLQKQKQKELLQKINLQKQLQKRAKQLQQLKDKQIKKFQLKQKLRKLNEQLYEEKKQLKSKDKNNLFFHQDTSTSPINSRSFMNPQNSHILKNKVSTTFIRDTSFMQKSNIKSKSDGEFRVKKLKQQQEVYTPVKHEAAFKLIEKMHAQKLRKHEKIVSEMRKKQEREIEEVKKLEEEKTKEKNLKRVRQVLYYTPKPTRLKNKIEQNKQNDFKREQNDFKRELSVDTLNPEKKEHIKLRDLLRPQSKKSKNQSQVNHDNTAKINQIEQQIGLVIPHQALNIKEKDQKNKTLYTDQYEQEPFQPQTEQGRQFFEALRTQQDNQYNMEQQEQQNEFVKEQNHALPKNQQIILDNQFI